MFVPFERMSDFSTISTETWRVSLPSDWVARESETPVYFESADGSKGAYFQTWHIRESDKTIQEELESFRRIERRSFDQMDGRTWIEIDHWLSDPPPVAISGFDCLDRKNNYRVVCQLLGSPPWIVRASFHDYDCSDYDVSKKFFESLIKSFQIHSADT